MVVVHKVVDSVVIITTVVVAPVVVTSEAAVVVVTEDIKYKVSVKQLKSVEKTYCEKVKLHGT